MCDGGVLTGLAIASAVGSTGLSLSTQRANQKAAQDWQRMQQREQNRISRQAAARDIAALNARFQQEAEATELEIEMNARAAMEARGTATVAAGESGGFGGSFNALLDKFKREETEFRTSQLRTQAARRRQLALEQAGVRTNLHGRLLAALPSPVQRPDYLGASLRVLGDVAGLAGAQVRHDAILRRSGG